MTELERFDACMEYRPADRRPNHELGVWPQTVQRWQAEAPAAIAGFGWDWFVAEPGIGLDRREYISLNYGFIPPFEPVMLEETDQYEIFRDGLGITHKALKEWTVGGGRMSMDQHLHHPVEGPEDWPDIKRRLVPGLPERYPPDWEGKIGGWERRGHVLVLGHTDNRPIRSVRYPSNWHLSQARADAAARLLLPRLGDPERLRTEGRADSEPVASNQTPEGRASNRRVEIVVYASPGR